MRRRDFILGGAIIAWPLAARGQQIATPVPVIGLLHAGAREESEARIASFRRGLSEAGYEEGRNLAIEYRWAEGNYGRLPALAAELIRIPVRVLAATTTPAALAAKAATTTIPVVFTTGGDPVALGLVASLNRPGSNVTGVTMRSRVLTAKQLELLHELVPQAAKIGFMVNPSDANAGASIDDISAAANALGVRLIVVETSTETEIGAAFMALVQQHVGALVVDGDAFILSRRDRVLALAERSSIPAIYAYREYVVAGGLMSYAPNLLDAYRQAGMYVGRIVNGEKPANLPVVQPQKFHFAINAKTAKTLGLTVPPTLLATADEVIE
jgi:putative tryptophan/tyrosine transport system substrate-binding protein